MFLGIYKKFIYAFICTNTFICLSQQNYEAQYKVYKLKAETFYNTSQIDSALYFLKKADSVITLSPDTDKKRLYKIISLNDQGKLERLNTKTTIALQYQEKVIKYAQNLIGITTNDSIKKQASSKLCSAYDEIAQVYKNSFQFVNAKQLIQKSYQTRLQFLQPNNPEVVKSLGRLANICLQTTDFNEARQYMGQVMQSINQNKQHYSKEDIAHFTLTNAQSYEATGDIINAKMLNLKSIKLYESIDIEKLDKRLLINAYVEVSKFFGRQRLIQEASIYAFKADNLAKEFSEEYEIKFQVAKLVSLIFQVQAKYDESIAYSNKMIHDFENKAINDTNTLKKINSQRYLPYIYHNNVSVKYNYKNYSSVDSLVVLDQFLQKGIDIINQRKNFITNKSEANTILANYQGYYDLPCIVKYNLFLKTNNFKHIEELINLKETLTYNKLRTQLYINDSINFKGVPKHIIEKEQLLKSNLSKAKNGQNITKYYEQLKLWEDFIKLLQTEYPKYYKIKYNERKIVLKDIQDHLKPNTTIVKYLIFGANIYTLLITKNEKFFIKIPPIMLSSLGELISKTAESNVGLDVYNDIYTSIWKPIEQKINTDHLIIIPDGILFSLSFESLTSAPIKNSSDFITHSLLSKHSIAYNYSLSLVKDNPPKLFNNNYIAFTPGFSNSMKSEYKIALLDSTNIDKHYLTLLPQPFTKQISDKYTKIFKGKAFANENASKQLFTKSAKEHKIIHIGTHAESNNINPELSRLVFAKNVQDSTAINDNYLYTYEIYNQDLSSNLAILTSCETGKPTYQPGEGMISLAHAFNYAGSESMLTSLWKIDEQSSAKILSFFYENLADGLPKDKALRNAKLSYLSRAKGRTKAPEYWASLLLFGNVQAIEIQTSSRLVYWLIGIAILGLIGLIWLRKTKKA